MPRYEIKTREIVVVERVYELNARDPETAKEIVMPGISDGSVGETWELELDGVTYPITVTSREGVDLKDGMILEMKEVGDNEH